MSWNPNSAKHKAMHNGYKKKPTQEQVKATLAFFSGISTIQKQPPNKDSQQLKLF
jgi:hypothetical protein